MIIHVQDVSHPDMLAQEKTVQKTLSDMKLPECLRENTIEIFNKVDLIEV